MSEKIEQFWRPTTADDIAKVMRGEKVEARFRDYDHADWTEFDLLGGFATSVKHPVSWFDVCGVRWFQCQVYDPPEWYVNKPDPGEGYRLLEKFPPEPKLGTDEVWRLFKKWEQTANDNGVQEEECWYRRRIEANTPEKPDSSRSKDYIPTGWRKLADDEPRLASDAYWLQGASEWCLIGEDRVEYANRDKWPAIRQVEIWKCMLLMEDCFYRLPNDTQIKITKKGFEVL